MLPYPAPAPRPAGSLRTLRRQLTDLRQHSNRQVWARRGCTGLRGWNVPDPQVSGFVGSGDGRRGGPLPAGPPDTPGLGRRAAGMEHKDFFAEATESNRYKITEVIGKGSYGIVASAVDQFTGERGAVQRLRARRAIVPRCPGKRACPLLRPGTLWPGRRPSCMCLRVCWGRGCTREEGSRRTPSRPWTGADRTTRMFGAGEKVAIKKITNVFDHVSDATRILREIKLLRLLRHPGA